MRQLYDVLIAIHVHFYEFSCRILQVDYEAKGWVAHQVSDIWAKTSRDRGKVVWSLWPMGGAWLCTHLWEHYTFTMDKVRFLFWIQSFTPPTPFCCITAFEVC